MLQTTAFYKGKKVWPQGVGCMQAAASCTGSSAARYGRKAVLLIMRSTLHASTVLSEGHHTNAPNNTVQMAY